ncbi:Acetyl-CoA acetyltransferase [Tenacibaculum dicentrarchi]|uniref:acetyl-CoA C-acetyltransferase n=2 Tax=Tenacibaculum dicentrarchi TaxID=669041 RepID=A0ABM9NZX9_9FLAO|nr:Acetyl-CoA acetyltransferase [Tenacibaculum dicentrarchi]SOU86883.1 Acetyl-CoA acetyltransferase [Tenacibaculum dicentrarchi]
MFRFVNITFLYYLSTCYKMVILAEEIIRKHMKEVVIVSVARTPIGSFLGSLSTIPAPKLGAVAIKGALEKINLNPTMIDEVFMGNVVSAGTGQAPARQAAIFAGIPNTVPCTTINKVCSSGMKAIMLAAQTIALGDAQIVVAGGMENMSMIPHYQHARTGSKFGSITMEDGLQKDGLVDAYQKVAMGVCADDCATKYGFSREEQDAFAIESYSRSANAWKEGKYADEIVSVEIPQRRGEPIIFSEDEEYKNVKIDKIPALRAAFTKEGTVTAANASTINDGAAALVLMSADKALALGLTPLAKIKGYADAAHEPEWFTTAPAKALPKALSKANISIDDVDYFELNEAFSVVGLANMKILNLSADKVNVNGGAVSLGHPLGVSGARIVIALTSILKQKNAKIGAAAICNGGGGASAIVIERI